MILLIVTCSLIGTVVLIGVCAPLSAVIPPAPPRDDPPQIVIEESFQDDCDSNKNCEGTVSDESSEGDTVKGNLRKWIASSSVPILRSRGLTDEEIKSELMRDFDLTEKQVDEILTSQ